MEKLQVLEKMELHPTRMDIFIDVVVRVYHAIEFCGWASSAG